MGFTSRNLLHILAHRKFAAWQLRSAVVRRNCRPSSAVSGSQMPVTNISIPGCVPLAITQNLQEPPNPNFKQYQGLQGKDGAISNSYLFVDTPATSSGNRTSEQANKRTNEQRTIVISPVSSSPGSTSTLHSLSFRVKCIGLEVFSKWRFVCLGPTSCAMSYSDRSRQLGDLRFKMPRNAEKGGDGQGLEYGRDMKNWTFWALRQKHMTWSDSNVFSEGSLLVRGWLDWYIVFCRFFSSHRYQTKNNTRKNVESMSCRQAAQLFFP